MICLARTETAQTALFTFNDDDEESNGDIEEGGSKDEQSKAISFDYTHISIPQPGHDTKVDHPYSPCLEVKEEEQSTNEDTTRQQAKETRVVPAFCAICLAKYELSERVCWASNVECSHVFHEDCALQWLVSLGRRRTMGQQFDKNTSEVVLMGFQPECPCCRQRFVDKKLMTNEDEEKV